MVQIHKIKKYAFIGLRGYRGFYLKISYTTDSLKYNGFERLATTYHMSEKLFLGFLLESIYHVVIELLDLH